MNWTKDFRKAVVEWDQVNWSRAIDFWNIESLCGEEPFRAMDLGARSDGLSILLAQSTSSARI